MMKNKRGWLRIVEAVAGILLLAGVLLVVYSQHQTKSSSGEYVYELQKNFLDYVASNSTLRKKVISGGVDDEDYLRDVADLSFPNNFNFTVEICELGALSCKPDPGVLPFEGEIFVEERIISATLEAGEFSPKKVRVFVWEAGG